MVLKLITNAQSAAKLLYIIEERSTIIPSREVDSILSFEVGMVSYDLNMRLRYDLNYQ